MSAATSLPLLLPSGEQRMLLRGVSWKDYVILREALDVPGLKLTYLEGRLELMSPSDAHENAKTIIARLIETYAFLRRFPLNGYGSTTFRHEAKERGVEPDECYLLGRELGHGQFPDIVLEVFEKSPLLDKLTVYAGLGVPEVWLFKNGKFTLHLLRGKGYHLAARSTLLPELDFALITRFAAMGSQQKALEALDRAVKAPPKRRVKR